MYRWSFCVSKGITSSALIVHFNTKRGCCFTRYNRHNRENWSLASYGALGYSVNREEVLSWCWEAGVCLRLTPRAAITTSKATRITACKCSKTNGLRHPIPFTLMPEVADLIRRSLIYALAATPENWPMPSSSPSHIRFSRECCVSYHPFNIIFLDVFM